MSMSFGPVKRQGFGEQITDYLRDAIVRGELSEGQRLVEEHLAEQFGVSRDPIRDALRRLEVESLVESRRTGTYVVGISDADIDELYSLRLAVEGLATSLAMERTPPDGWSEMATLVDTLDATADQDDHEAFATADIQFHSHIYALSGHRRLLDIWYQYAPLVTTLLRAAVREDSGLHDSAAKHRLLLAMMVSGDQTALIKELQRHLENSHQRMLQAHRKVPGMSSDPGGK